MALLLVITTVSVASATDTNITNDSIVDVDLTTTADDTSIVSDDSQELSNIDNKDSLLRDDENEEMDSVNYTESNFDELNATWYDIIENGTTSDRYVINLESGTYNFTEALKANSTILNESRTITLNGTNCENIIFSAVTVNTSIINITTSNLNLEVFNVTFQDVNYTYSKAVVSSNTHSVLTCYGANITDCVFRNNSFDTLEDGNRAVTVSGALISSSSKKLLSINNCSFIDNILNTSATYIFYSGNISMINSTVINNTHMGSSSYLLRLSSGQYELKYNTLDIKYWSYY